jgi:hypothetical protein
MSLLLHFLHSFHEINLGGAKKVFCIEICLNSYFLFPGSDFYLFLFFFQSKNNCCPKIFPAHPYLLIFFSEFYYPEDFKKNFTLFPKNLFIFFSPVNHYFISFAPNAYSKTHFFLSETIEPAIKISLP